MEPDAPYLGSTGTKTSLPDKDYRPEWASLARLALVLTALTAFLPSIPGWLVSWRYHQIPRLPTVTQARFHQTASGAPPLVDAEAIAEAPDGTLFVADWVLRHVLAIRPDGTGHWLPPEGRFLPQVGAGGQLHLLDVDSGRLYRFSGAGQVQRRVAVAPPHSSPVFCVAPDGSVLVAAAGTLVRFGIDLDRIDPAWGPPPHAVSAPDVAGLAASPYRVYAAFRNGSVSVFSSTGELLRSEPLVGNAGALALGPDGRLVLADRRTGRLFVLDEEGRTRGLLVSAEGKAPVSSPGGLAFSAGGRLAVAAGRSVDLLAPPGVP